MPVENSKLKPTQIENIHIADGSTCMISGWGSQNVSSRDRPHRLQVANVKIISELACKKQFRLNIPSQVLCLEPNSPSLCKVRKIGKLQCKTEIY